MSVAGYRGLVERWWEVDVAALGADGEPVAFRAQRWLARILQHEVDHLDGTVYVDRMVTRSFDPGFRIALHQKDLGLALSSARQLGLSLPNTSTTLERFNACVAQGGAGWDHSGMTRALERLAGHEIGQA